MDEEAAQSWGTGNMTKKDFELIAGCLRNSRPIISPGDKKYEQWYFTVQVFIQRLLHDNPRFDDATFLKRCHDSK